MKNIRTVVVCLIIALVASSVSAAPKLTIEKPNFNFGYAPQNSKISYEFLLQSTGDEELKITKVIPGCGCTKAPLKKDILAPGESTALEVIFSTKKYKNRITKTPRIETNEGNQPQRVTIIIHVVSRPDSTYPVVMKPYKLDLSQFTEKVRDKIEFTISNVSESDVNLKLIYAPDDYFKIDLPEKIDAKSSAKAVLYLNENVLEKSFEKSFTFEVDDEKNSRFTIPVKRTVRSSNAALTK